MINFLSFYALLTYHVDVINVIVKLLIDYPPLCRLRHYVGYAIMAVTPRPTLSKEALMTAQLSYQKWRDGRRKFSLKHQRVFRSKFLLLFLKNTTFYEFGS
jgi:hypothetical protein